MADRLLERKLREEGERSLQRAVWDLEALARIRRSERLGRLIDTLECERDLGYSLPEYHELCCELIELLRPTKECT